MLVAAHIVEIALMVLIPLLLARGLSRQYGLPWGLFGIGTLAYIGSEMAGIGLLSGLEFLIDRGMVPFPTEPSQLTIAGALVIGLVAAICQETARWIVFRHVVPERGMPTAGMVGLGHGGMESILTGLLVLIVMVTAVGLEGRGSDELAAMGLGDRTAVKVGLRVWAWWEASASSALLAALRQVLILVCQLAATALVMYGVYTERARFWAVAVLWHFGWAFVSQYVSTVHGPAAEIFALGGVTVLAAGVLSWISQRLPKRREDG